jgi:hypothetical protein
MRSRKERTFRLWKITVVHETTLQSKGVHMKDQNRKIVESRNLTEQLGCLHTCSKQGCMQQPHPHAELPWSDPSISIYTHLFDSPLDAKLIFRILKHKISSTWETNPRSKRTIAMWDGAAIGLGKTLVQCDILKIGSLMKLCS